MLDLRVAVLAERGLGQLVWHVLAVLTSMVVLTVLPGAGAGPLVYEAFPCFIALSAALASASAASSAPVPATSSAPTSALISFHVLDLGLKCLDLLDIIPIRLGIATAGFVCRWV